MKGSHYPPEKGEMHILGKHMEWTMTRSRNESAFGIRGSRIFKLELKKDGKVIGRYNRGWDLNCQIGPEEEEGSLCLSYLLDKYGRQSVKKKKDMNE